MCAGGKKPTARSIKQDFETFLKVSKSAQRGEKTFSTRWGGLYGRPWGSSDSCKPPHIAATAPLKGSPGCAGGGMRACRPTVRCVRRGSCGNWRCHAGGRLPPLRARPQIFRRGGVYPARAGAGKTCRGRSSIDPRCFSGLLATKKRRLTAAFFCSNLIPAPAP